MEFRFNINKIFKNNISRIGNSLLPVGFVAVDRRTALWVTHKFLNKLFISSYMQAAAWLILL